MANINMKMVVIKRAQEVLRDTSKHCFFKKDLGDDLGLSEPTINKYLKPFVDAKYLSLTQECYYLGGNGSMSCFRAMYHLKYDKFCYLTDEEINEITKKKKKD